MSTTGTEVVTLSQLKMLGVSGAGGKKYKIESGLPTQVQSSASAGDVVVTAAGDGVVDYTVLEMVGEGSSSWKVISKSYLSSSDASIDDLPQVVQDALANMPQTMAPPPTGIGYSWFIMPPCDVFLQSY